MKNLFILVCLCVFLTGFTNIDVPQICREQGRQELLEINNNYFKLSPDLLLNGAPQDIAQTIVSTVNHGILVGAPWLLQEPYHPNASYAGYLIQLQLAQRFVKRFYPNATVKDVLTQAASKPAIYSNEALAQAHAAMQRILSIDVVPGIKQVIDNAKYLCAQYMNAQCTPALQEAMRMMSTRIVRDENDYGYFISLPTFVNQLMTDPRLVQGAAHFALKIIDRMKTPLRDRHRFNQTNLYAELIDSFMKVGHEQVRATLLAQTLLSIYGTRGASLFVFETFANRENLPVFLSLYIFSSALGYLDGLNLKSGLSPYTLTFRTKTQCSYGFPYHYWLSFILTGQLLMKGYDYDAAAIAIHIASKLYEYGGQTGSRTPDRVYREHYRNTYNIGIQKNMAYNDAGVFAVTRREPINMDQGFAKMYSDAKPLPSMPPDVFERGLKNPVVRYAWFHQIIAPDSFFKMIIPDPSFGNFVLQKSILPPVNLNPYITRVK